MRNTRVVHKLDMIAKLMKWQEENTNTPIKPGDHVKICLKDYEDDQIGEHLWIIVTIVDGSTIIGTIDNDPINLTTYKDKQVISFPRTEIEQLSRDLYVGDIVELNQAGFLGEGPGTKCYVYEEYELNGRGVSVITENGVNLGGFSEEETFMYLTNPRPTGTYYNFTNVIKLDQDFETKIKPLFKK